MPVTAKLQFTQGATVGNPGEAIVGVSGTAVTCSNVDNASGGGVRNWKYTLTDISGGASVQVAHLLSDGPVPTATVTPDTYGTWRVELVTTGNDGTLAKDARVIIVPNARGWKLPAFSETADEVNYRKADTSLNRRGWADAMDFIFSDIVTALGGGPAPTPLDPPMSGMKLWLRPDSVSGGGSPLTLVSGGVSAWADQSGAGVVTSVAQSDPTKRLTVGTGTNGKPKLVGTGTQFLESATTLLAAGTARTVVVVAAAASGNGGALVTFRRTTPFISLLASPVAGLHYTVTTHDGTSVQNRVNPTFAMTTATALEYRYVAGPVIPRLVVNGVQQPMNSETNINNDLSTSDTGAAGITIGGRADDLAQCFNGDLYEVLIYDHDLSAPDEVTLRAYLNQRYGIAFAAASTKNRMVFDGDSITQGSGVAAFTDTWPYLVQQTLGASTWDIADMGLQGTDAGACNIRYSKQCAPLFETVRSRNYLIILIGTNNLVAAGGAVDIYALISAEVAKAVYPGTNFKVYVCTITGRQDALWLASATAEPQRVILNGLIRANAAQAHGVIDFAQNTTLNTAPASHFPDGVHPNLAGNTLMASIASAKLAEVPTMATFASVGIEKWLHASAYDPVTAVWTDASGLGNHFSQASVPAQPTLTSAWRNGKPAVRTTTTTFLETSTNIGTPGAAFTEIFVGERIGASGGNIAQYRKTGVVCEASHLTVSSAHYIYSDAVVVNVLLNVSWDPTITANAFLSIWRFNGTGTLPSIVVGHADRPINVGASGNQTTESGNPGAFYGKSRTPGQEWDGNGAFSARLGGVLSDDLRTKMLSYLWDEWRV
jgi:lysophospholipase L1-like esterase